MKCFICQMSSPCAFLSFQRLDRLVNTTWYCSSSSSSISVCNSSRKCLRPHPTTLVNGPCCCFYNIYEITFYYQYSVLLGFNFFCHFYSSIKKRFIAYWSRLCMVNLEVERYRLEWQNDISSCACGIHLKRKKEVCLLSGECWKHGTDVTLIHILGSFFIKSGPKDVDIGFIQIYFLYC